MALIRLGALLAGAYLGRSLEAQAVTLRRVSQITISAEKPLPVHVDGEMIQSLNQ